jgi:lipopolysaccharide export system permease protein
MKLLDRYLSRAISAGTALALGILVSVDSFIDFVDEVNDVGEHGYTLWHAVYRTLLSLPQGLYEFFPTAVLLGGLLGLGNLAANNELTVLRASGVSIVRIIGAVLKTGIVMMVVAVFVGEIIAPVSQQRAQNVKTWAQPASVTLRELDGLWVKDGNHFINIKGIYPRLRLNDIRVYTVDDEQRLTEITFAASAIYTAGEWLLTDLSRSLISHNGVVTKHTAHELWPRLLVPELLRVITVEPEHMSAWKLTRYIDYLKANHLDAQRYELALWTRFTLPLSSLVMLLLALPFVFGPLRSGGAGQRLFIGILIGLAFHLFNRALNHLALVYGLDPFLGAALPLGVFTVVGLVAILRIR